MRYEVVDKRESFVCSSNIVKCDLCSKSYEVVFNHGSELLWKDKWTSERIMTRVVFLEDVFQLRVFGKWFVYSRSYYKKSECMYVYGVYKEFMVKFMVCSSCWYGESVRDEEVKKMYVCVSDLFFDWDLEEGL